MPLVIAHRGNSAYAPENTFAAFERAVQAGADMIELDVQPAKDGQLVVFHDRTVDRVSQGRATGAVSDLTVAELKRIDVGSPLVPGEQIPTLEETLVAFRGRARFLVETKGEGFEERVAAVIERTGMADSVIVQSFQHEAVRRLRALLPRVPAGALFGRVDAQGEVALAAHFAAESLAVHASMVAPHCQFVTAAVVAELKRRALTVFTWTVNEPDEMERVLAAGVDGIITDDPGRLRELLEPHA